MGFAVCFASLVCVWSLPMCFAPIANGQTQQSAASSANSQANSSGNPAASRRVGKIKAINGTVITLTPDSGADVSVTVQDATRLRRIAPGETDPKKASPLDFKDLQVGDLIRVVGIASADGKSMAAASIVALKASDIAARNQHELQDWQKGVGGLVSAVDASAGTVTVSVTSFSGKKTIVIHSSPHTVIRRYAPDSVKFDDAKPSALVEIHPGDQVRARGERSADGSELTADEIVSGSFRNVAGTVVSVDASSSTLDVHDLLAKKNVTVKVTADSQLRKLPAEMAQRIAMRLKGAAAAGIPGAGSAATPAGGGAGASGTAGDVWRQAPSNGGAGPPGAGSGMAGGRSGGAPDFQQMLSRMPASPLTDLHKGDAVLIVATEGAGGAGTAIILLSGVEAILQASPSAGQAMMMSPWSLGAPAGDAGGP